MLRTIFSPDGLRYPVIVAAINVQEGQEVAKGDLVVRLHDRDGKMLSIASPFDGTVTALDVKFGQQLFERSKIAWLHVAESVAEEVVVAEPGPVPAPKPAPAPGSATPSPRAARSGSGRRGRDAAPDPSKRYYVNARGAWVLRMSGWLGFLLMFLAAVWIMAFEPDILEVFGDRPILVFAAATLGPLIAGLLGMGAGEAIADMFSASAREETAAREAVTERIKQGEDVALPKGLFLPPLLGLALPLLGGYLLATDQIEIGNGYDRYREAVLSSRSASPSVEAPSRQTTAPAAAAPADFDVRRFLTENTGSARKSEELVRAVMGQPVDQCFRAGLHIRASALDRKQCQGCPKTEREAQIDTINYSRDRYIKGQGDLAYIDALEFNLGYASTRCQGTDILVPITKYLIYTDQRSVCDQGTADVRRDLAALEASFHATRGHCRARRPWARHIVRME